MNFRKVSVLVPTRKRLGYLKRMLETYQRTVGDSELAEIVFRCDADDPETINFLRAHPFKTIIGQREEGYKSLPRFFNEMARIASGDLLICCNDDVVFLTPGWPQILLATASKFPDGVFNFGVNVGLNDEKFPFSIVSRRLRDILGFINDERLLFSDVFLLDVAKAFERAIRIPEVMISHDWAGHEADETRIDANQHEFSMVFKDETGVWSDNYRSLHERAVQEAVDKIRTETDISVDLLMNRMASYHAEPHKLHYTRPEMIELLRVMAGRSLFAGTIVLTNYANWLPNLFWSQLFSRVITIQDNGAENQTTAQNNGAPVHDGKNEIYLGNVTDSKFLYNLMHNLTDLRVLVLDDIRYSHLISPYFLLGSRIRKPGMVVFAKTAHGVDEFDGMRRFLADLQRGFLDNRAHDINFAGAGPNAAGTAYELID